MNRKKGIVTKKERKKWEDTWVFSENIDDDKKRRNMIERANWHVE